MRTRIPLFLVCLGLLIAAPVMGGFHPDPPEEDLQTEDSPQAGSSVDADVHLTDVGLEDVGLAEADLADLEARILPWPYFSAMAEQDGVMVIDVREEFLGHPVPAGLETARPIPMGIFLVNFVQRGANRDKTLLIFDHDGKAVPRLYRALVDQGYRDFFFLSGGAVRTRELPHRGS